MAAKAKAETSDLNELVAGVERLLAAATEPEPLELDVTATEVRLAREKIEGRLRRAIVEIGYAAHDPGGIAGLVSDIQALNRIYPGRRDKPLPPPPPSAEEQRQAQKRAHDEHKRQEERAARRPS